ncbi:WbqC family protein [Lutispora sp.]|uniref:WbqC family protein n=1 Tax=Lutispora sp. TaxID=2828727 RepID=UPI003569F97A
MRVAISQPEHFPYLGYFQKMVACDLFVILDSVQFSGPRSFQNRNCFTNKAGLKQWFTVPVSKNSYFKCINEVETAPDYGWRKKLIKTLTQNFRGIDYEKIYNYDKLVDINLEAIGVCRTILGIETPMIRSSSLSVGGSKVELIYNICRELGASEYISGQGARKYLNNCDFGKIKVTFLEPKVVSMDSVVVYLSKATEIQLAKTLLEPFRIND